VSPLDSDRALPADPTTRAIAREIYGTTAGFPIVSMHGHVDAGLFVRDEPFPDPAELFIRPDHYLTRMLGSQRIGRAELGLPEDPAVPLPDPRRTWRLFCENWRLYRATPTRYWLEHILGDVFGTDTRPSAETADTLYDELASALARPEFRPTALLERFRIETLATTDGAADDLTGHAQLATADLSALVIPTFRPDALFAVSGAAWRAELDRLQAAVGREIGDLAGFLDALGERRLFFSAAGARATDHASVTADIAPLDGPTAAAVFARALAGEATAADEAAFVAHMLFEMARMSDIPVATEYTRGLRPVLEAFGHHPGLTFVVFTLDETSFSRELAPLAGVFPAMRLGAPWWFLDTPGGMRRFREAITDNAGFYNTSGFVDDTRAFCSIPARHDLSRRVDAGYLAQLVAEGRLPLDEAVETAADLAYNLPRETYPALTADAR
jgi:glucuronate isomerase